MKKNIVIIAFIVVFLEIFIFNFSSIKSLFYKGIKIDKNDLILNGIIYAESSNKYFIESNDNYIEININEKINNIYLDIERLSHLPFKINIDYTDSANNYYRKFRSNVKNERYIVSDIEKSKYIDLYHFGNTGKMKINLDLNVVNQFKINEITFNKLEPIHTNWFRMIGLFLIIFVIYNYFNNKKFKLFINNNQNKVIFIIILLFSCLTIFLYQKIGYLSDSDFHDYYQDEYVEALSNGKLTIKENIDLSKLNNPYDYSERIEKGISTTWDVSYYNNNYYVYFGMFPAFIMMIFKMLFNIQITTTFLSCCFSILSVIFGSLLIKEIIEKYTKCSVGLKLLMIIFFLFNSRLLLIIPKTRFYELINVSGFAFSLIGIYLYMLFARKNKNIYLFLGSLFLSLLLLIRPTMIIVSFLGFYIIYKKLNKKNIIFLIPFIIVGLITMYLNYIRFGNIFEFGITYQLGILDNSYSKFNLISILNGIYTYLLRFPIVDTTFPYIFNNISMLEYFGFYFNTATGNGILTMSILGLIVPFMVRKINKETIRFIIFCLILGFIILCIDSVYGGSLKRYSIEFSWLFLIPIILMTINSFKNKKILIIIVLLSCLMNFLVIFDLNHDDNIQIDNSELYYDLMYF